MRIFIGMFTLLLFTVVGSMSVNAQDTSENHYQIENAILGYYYTCLCSEQGSLASIEQQKEFAKRKFAEQDIEKLQDPFSHDLLFNKKWYNQKTGASSLDDDGLLWGDMRDAEYFTLHFDEIKFDYPHQATVKAHIDYGVRTVNMVYGMHLWNDKWWIDDIAVTLNPVLMLSDWIHKGVGKSDKQVENVEENISVSSDREPVYNIATIQQRPEFPGGMKAAYKWIADNVQYPSGALEKEIYGRVIVEFVITKTGEIENARVLRSVHPVLDKEAVRVIKCMPQWRPGKHKGDVVNVVYTLPVTFKIPTNE